MSFLDELSFPIGPYNPPHEVTPEHRQKWVDSLESFPDNLEKAIAWLTTAQLDTPYRPEGWTVRQLVHHIADSHMNAYIRIKLGLTENEPSIKTYDQDAWAELKDATLSVEISLKLITALHSRWVAVLKDIKDWSLCVYNPDRAALLSLDDLTGYYAWHAEHHLAHIVKLIERKGW